MQVDESAVIPLHNLDWLDNEAFPCGTKFIPMTFTKNGKEEFGYVAITPDTLDPQKFDKEKERLLDMVIDKNIKSEDK